ncbi:hypothetical protein vseg_008578 [Gypsophila vaccaria]
MNSLLSLPPKTNYSHVLNYVYGFHFPPIPYHHRTGFGLNFHPRRFRVSSKKSSFQDFQKYVKPKRLLGARGLKSFRDETPNKLVSSLKSDGSESVYKVLLRTSSIYGSGLSDLNAQVLICIIDEHGDSILEKIPAILQQDQSQNSVESADIDRFHFREGSIDEFVLFGSKLGRIQAMWVSLESGSWRLRSASLTTLSVGKHEADESNITADVLHSLTYDFEAEDVLLGEGGDTTMVELRPCQVLECSGVDPFEIASKNSGQALSAGERKRMNEESMREYANLKYSQLIYDSILTLAGTIFSAVTRGEDTAVAFFTGGIGGFLYLVLLQRSVDKLPSPESGVTGDTSNSIAVKGPLQLGVLAIALGVAMVIRKHGAAGVDSVEAGLGLAPTEILVGVLGFLASKLAVILSAIKPLSKTMQ